MDGNVISAEFLKQQNFALFESLPSRAFRFVNDPPEFWKELTGVKHTAGNTVTLAEEFPFLESFLNEAEKVWTTRSEQCAESGTWVEKNSAGRSFALEASALWLAGTRVLAIQNPQKRFEHESRLQQMARDSMLAHQRLHREVQKKEILLHCIIHDLFQPLTVMRACFTMLAMKEGLSQSIQDSLEMANRQAQRQEEMMRGILGAFSADLAAQKSLEDDPANAPDIARACKTTVENFAPAFEEKKVDLLMDEAVDLKKSWRVRGDEPHLVRILGNLVENALRHSPAGSAVKIGVKDEGEFVSAYIDDGGPGLPDGETAERLFEMFAKGKDDRAGKAGLGLYFCKMTVGRWGGSIGCLNRPGGGARFWFRLPRVVGK